MYRIEQDPRRGRVALAFDGVMQQDPQTFFGELTGAVDRVRARVPDWDLLIDFSQTPVMPQDRAQNTARIFQWCLDHNIRKVACITASITQRMQLQRVTGRSDKLGFFEHRGAAESWLAA